MIFISLLMHILVYIGDMYIDDMSLLMHIWFILIFISLLMHILVYIGDIYIIIDVHFGLYW